MLPIINLDHISGEAELLPIVKQILLNNDTFLLKNYANIESLQRLISNLKSSNQITNGLKPFDNNDFTGLIPLYKDNELNDTDSDDDDNNNSSNTNPSFWVEQYVHHPNSNTSVSKNVTCQRILNHLWSIGQFFTEVAIHCFNGDASGVNNSGNMLSSMLTRYVNTDPINEQSMDDILVNDNTDDWISISSSGLLLLFPLATGIKIKPATSSIDDNLWTTVNEPGCLLVHTGGSLQRLSGGLHTTTPIQIDPKLCPIYLTVYQSFNDSTVMKDFIREQILQYPYIGSKYYPTETNRLTLNNEVKYLIKLFNSCETIMSLYSIQRPSNGDANPSITKHILPQLNRMVQGNKITVQTFLKMMTLWPHCYELDYSLVDEDDLVVVVPKRNNLISMVNESRKLTFYKNAMKWLEDNDPDKTNDILTEVPVFQLRKRQITDQDTTATLATTNYLTQRRLAIPFKRGKYIKNNNNNSNSSNSSDDMNNNSTYDSNSSYFKFKEKPFDTQENLLQRIKLKENSALWERDKQDKIYDKFLLTKTKQVLNILKSLHVAEPYTVTQLTNMIVDSLYDGNNPIDLKEAETILDKLVEQRSDIKLLITTDGLKVYRWEKPL